MKFLAQQYNISEAYIYVDHPNCVVDYTIFPLNLFTYNIGGVALLEKGKHTCKTKEGLEHVFHKSQ